MRDPSPRPVTEFTYGGRQYRFLGYSPRDYIYRRIRDDHTFLEVETLEFIRNRRLAGTYVDVGANIGNHSVYFLSQTNCSKVTAIEGNPEIMPILAANLRQNVGEEKSYRTFATFASTRGQLFFNLADDQNVGSSFVTEVMVGANSVPVDCLSVDELVFDSDDVSLIKIDVEGHEIEVLKSAHGLLTNARPEICIESLHIPLHQLSSFMIGYNYLPIVTLPNYNVYFVAFPRFFILLIRALALLPLKIRSRVCWRVVRSFALFTGRLKSKQLEPVRAHSGHPACPVNPWLTTWE